MIIGPYKVSLIDAGDFRLDGGAMFGVVPRTLWSRTNPPDDANRIAMTMRCLLIEGDGHKILVDTGAGDKDGEASARSMRLIRRVDHCCDRSRNVA